MITAPENQSTMRAVKDYLKLEAEPTVKAANITAMAAGGMNDAELISIAARALGDPNKHVKLAALQAVYRAGPQERSRVLSVVNRLAEDPAEDLDVRKMADRFSKNWLTDP